MLFFDAQKHLYYPEQEKPRLRLGPLLFTDIRNLVLVGVQCIVPLLWLRNPKTLYFLTGTKNNTPKMGVLLE